MINLASDGTPLEGLGCTEEDENHFSLCIYFPKTITDNLWDLDQCKIGITILDYDYTTQKMYIINGCCKCCGTNVYFNEK